MATKPITESPLSANDLRELNKAQFLVNAMVEKMDRAERAMTDVSHIREFRQSIADQIAAIKREYFTGQQ